MGQQNFEHDDGVNSHLEWDNITLNTNMASIRTWNGTTKLWTRAWRHYAFARGQQSFEHDLQRNTRAVNNTAMGPRTLDMTFNGTPEFWPRLSVEHQSFEHDLRMSFECKVQWGKWSECDLKWDTQRTPDLWTRHAMGHNSFENDLQLKPRAFKTTSNEKPELWTQAALGHNSFQDPSKWAPPNVQRRTTRATMHAGC